jgi:hypothetical protein
MVLAVAVLAAGVPVLRAASASAWSPREVLAKSSREYGSLAAYANAGGLGAIWTREYSMEEDEDRLELAPWGARLAAPVLLSDASSGGGPESPGVAVADPGTTIAVWAMRRVIEAREVTAGGAASSVRRLSGGVVGEAGKPTIATNGTRTVIAFVTTDFSSGTISYVVRSGGRWRQRRSVVSASDATFSDPRVTVDSRGEAMLAWIRDGKHDVVQAAVIGRDGRRHGGVMTVSPSGQNAAQLHLSANGDGKTLAVWRSGGHATGAVEAAVRTGRGFSRPQLVAAGPNAEPGGAVADGGGMVVIFTHVLSTQPGDAAAKLPSGFIPVTTQTTAVDYATRSGTRWSVASLASAGPVSTFEGTLTSLPHTNTFVAAWLQAPFRAYPGQVMTATNSDGGWEGATGVSPPQSRDAILSAGGTSEPWVLWVRSDEPTGGEFVEASRDTPAD